MKNTILIFCLMVVCFSVNSQVVINEVMHKPATSSSVNQGFYKKEYVEIYNPTCSPIDISCWILGSSAPLTGSTPYWVGAFQFPSGTIINPGQHLVIGGTNSDNGTAYNPSDIDFIVQGSPNTCIAGSGGWLLPNGDGWVALYNSSGMVEDALYWSLSANPNLTTDLDFSTNPCLPTTSCSPISSLMSCRQIFQNYPSKLSYGGLSTSFDLTFSRVPDGGNWQRDVPSTITGSQCNNGVCNTPSTFNLNTSLSQPNCNSNDGNISFNPIPAASYTYSWSPNVSSSNTATNLSAGTYTITITNPSGCQKDTTITLTSNSGITNAIYTIIDANCNQTNGSIEINGVTGGTSPYSYNFNNSGFSTNTLFQNLGSGNYNLVIEDVNGCQYNLTNLMVNNGNSPSSATYTITDANCNQSNGSIEITGVTGGTSPYTYNFNNTGFSSNTLFQNIASGSYSVIIEDNNGCQYNLNNLTVANGNGPTNVSLNTTDANCNQSNGSVQITNVTGGVGPYEFDFNQLGFTTSTVYNNLLNGTYTLSVRDNNGCLYNAPDITINSIAGPNQATVSTLNPTCGLSNGQVSVSNITGGTAPYQINFNSLGGTSNFTFSNLAAGNYTLEIIDQNGCSYFAPIVNLTNIPGPTNASTTSIDASCNLSNGSIVINNVSGGSQPYQYALNNGNFVSSNTFSNLSGGTYSITVQDANGCTYNLSNININSSGGISSIDFTTIDASCGLQNGELIINNVFGGLAPYTYSLNNGNYSPTSNYFNLNNGMYTLNIQDGNGCQYDTSFQINGGQTPKANFNILPGTVNSLDADNVKLINTSSTDVVEWSWYMANGNPSQSNIENPVASFSGLPAGSYPIQLIVTNSSGCTDTIIKYLEILENILVFAPNTFTPDKDEFNDTWRVYLNNVDLSYFELTIYNRWGETLFYSENSEIGWDGTYSNNICPDGTYTWTLNLKDQSNDAKYSFKGHINLIR